jgi:hypothetical protein
VIPVPHDADAQLCLSGSHPQQITRRENDATTQPGAGRAVSALVDPVAARRGYSDPGTARRDGHPVQRTLCFRTCDNDRLLLQEHTLAFRLTPGCERGAEPLGVTAGTRVRVELLDDAGHLLDWRTYYVPPTDRSVTGHGA